MLAWKSNRDILVSAAAALMTLVGFCVQAHPLAAAPEQTLSTAFLQLHPELPFVTASGLAFLEMDHREAPQFSDRLYYLTNRTAAIQYAHATIFEALLPMARRYFPVRANVVPYDAFLRAHSHFLVFGTPGQPEDWLVDKLKDDGATIRQIANMKTSYRDTTLYDVQFIRAVR